MSNTVCRPLSGEQIEHMLHPQWRGHLSQAPPSNEYIARLREVSAQKSFAEEVQREQERGGFQLLPPCNWRDPLEALIVRVIPVFFRFVKVCTEVRPSYRRLV